jgi:hypothetical protein
LCADHSFQPKMFLEDFGAFHKHSGYDNDFVSPGLMLP